MGTCETDTNMRLRCRWKYIIKIVIKEMGFEDVNWIYLAQDRFQWQNLVGMAMNDRAA
jgi:hypothetical protein